MRIKLINPSMAGEQFKLVTEMVLKSLPLTPDTIVDFASLKEGPDTIRSERDVALAGPPLLEEIKQAEEEGYDAVVIHCFSDPCLYAAREIVDIPVVGPGETAILFALTLGGKVTVISPFAKPDLSGFMRRVMQFGINPNVFTIRGIGFCSAVELIAADKEDTKKRILEQAKKAMDGDNAEVIVMGCTGMSEFARELQSKLEIPVVDPLSLALKMAELQVNLKLSHSKIAYGTRRTK